MKYVAVLDTDDYEDFGFFEDGKEKYLHAVDAYATNGEWIYLPFKPLEQEPTTKDDLGVDREDAVERLNALKQFIGYDKDSEIVKATQKSLDMAIKALEHPEKNVIAVVPCGDAISRQAVLDLMMHIWGENFSGDSAMQESIDAIRALPSVTPQERKGHWIKTPKAVMGEGYMWYCDKCEYQVYQDSSRDYPSEKYCPNCGSDNREVEE